ncbi:hypothetical protein DFH11DRAFT_1068126 [Phellopilus nigrolimitatus]|nr:hypothetical protein DFH11DRAFT_1068126 [Phellopilus nigrolimitatus]
MPAERHHLLTQKKYRAPFDPVLCAVCRKAYGPRVIRSVRYYEKHAQSKRHLKALLDCGLGADPGPVKVRASPCHHCSICSETVSDDLWIKHVRSERHTQATVRTLLDEGVVSSDNKHGVEVRNVDPVTFKRLHAGEKRTRESKYLKIQNESDSDVFLLTAVFSSNRLDCRASLPFHLKMRQIMTIKPHFSRGITIFFEPPEESGTYQDTIELYFANLDRTQYFAISRTVTCIIPEIIGQTDTAFHTLGIEKQDALCASIVPVPLMPAVPGTGNDVA